MKPLKLRAEITPAQETKQSKDVKTQHAPVAAKTEQYEQNNDTGVEPKRKQDNSDDTQVKLDIFSLAETAIEKGSPVKKVLINGK